MPSNKKPALAPRPEPPRFRMFRSLHPQVAEAVFDQIGTVKFINKHSKTTLKQSYSSNITGRFTCHNTSCATAGWGSKMIAIIIRQYAGNGYNALVFNQRCKGCEQLGSFMLDEDVYVERVSYRLMKWAGLNLEPPPHSGKSKSPHEEKLCEGCKARVCPESRRKNGSNRLGQSISPKSSKALRYRSGYSS